MTTVDKIKKAVNSPYSMAFMFLLACVGVILEKEVESVLIFVLITTVVFAFPQNGLHAFYPAMLACCIAIKCYDSFDTFIKFFYIPIPIIIIAIVKLCKGAKNYERGDSFFGILAVAIAVTLGGIGTISAGEYFAPTSLYYVLALGAGMILFYFAARYGIHESDEDTFGLFALFMYIIGLFCMFEVLQLYATYHEIIFYNGKFLSSGVPRIDQLMAFKFQMSNNASTIMMFCLPFPFCYAVKKHSAHFFVGIAMLACMWMTTSRGAMLMGTIEAIVCVIYACIHKRKLIIHTLSLLVAGVAIMIFYPPVTKFVANYISFDKLKNIIDSGEARVKLISRSIEDFLGNPIFGQGLGNVENTDLYNPRKGAMVWYHMMIPQVVGSLGLVGILAYAYQIFDRIRFIFKDITAETMCLGISYLGILLMSQVNPGEFCPIPYEMITVMLFIFLEKNMKNKGLCIYKKKEKVEIPTEM